MLFLSRRPLVAIDIGSYSIKMVHLQKKGNGLELINMAMITLPPDSVVDGEIENPEAVIEALKNLIKAEGVKNKNVVMSISGQSVIIKKISVPEISDEDVSEMINKEAEQYIPFDIEEVNLDFQAFRLPPAEEDAAPPAEDEEKQMDVLIVAARKDTIQVFQDVVKEVGLNLRVLDLDVFALENAYEHNYDFEPDTAFAIVNVGGTMTNVNIMENDVTAFTRDIPVGGNNISEEIQKNLSVGFSEAEKLKLGVMFDDFKEEDIVPHLLAGINGICDEVRKTLDLYEKTSDYKVSKIYLSGGSSLLKGLNDVMTEKIGVETTLMRSFRNISINSKTFDSEYIEKMEPVMALPIGLAIRMADDK